MISRIRYLDFRQTVPYQNLALEEWLLHYVQPGECILYLWQNQNTVVVGRNQNAWKECKIMELEADGGYLVRRLSGGGAVYHDLGNLNFTFFACDGAYDISRQTEVILHAVHSLGINAEKTGRNDLTVEGRKFSGHAFFSAGGKNYHHGTLLVQVDLQSLSKYLNVSAEKLKSKGVDSVKSRVTNLTDFRRGITIDLMRSSLIEAFGEVYGLSPESVSENEVEWADVARLSEKFASWEWRFGRKISFETDWTARFPWGDLQIQLRLEAGKIFQAQVYSDAMDVAFVGKLQKALEGCRYHIHDLSEAVGRLSAENVITREMCEDLQDFLRNQTL